MTNPLPGDLTRRRIPMEPLGWNIIHSVTNPTGKLTGSIHVYGGDFFTKKRSEWNPETLQEQPYDMARTDRFFDDGNALYRFMKGASR